MEFMTNLQSGLDDQKPSLFGNPFCRNTKYHTTDFANRTSVRATIRCPHTAVSTLPSRCRNPPSPPLPPPHPQLLRRTLRLHLIPRRTPLLTHLRRRLHRKLLRPQTRKSTAYKRPRDPSRLPRSPRTSPRNPQTHQQRCLQESPRYGIVAIYKTKTRRTLRYPRRLCQYPGPCVQRRHTTRQCNLPTTNIPLLQVVSEENIPFH